jgi:hypothetical protein
MQEFELPVLRADDTTESAFEAMHEMQRSGILVQEENAVRLIHFDQVLEAHYAGKTRLGQIDDFVSLRVVASPSEAHFDSGERFMAIRSFTGFPFVALSEHEPFAGPTSWRRSQRSVRTPRRPTTTRPTHAALSIRIPAASVSIRSLRKYVLCCRLERC